MEQNQGTFAPNLNTEGIAAGTFVDSNLLNHGYFRMPNGTVKRFDVLRGLTETTITGINRSGAVTGTYYDANSVAHGFVRGAAGKVEKFSAPGAGTSYPQGTFSASLNDRGDVAGYYIGEDNVQFGFVRTR